MFLCFTTELTLVSFFFFFNDTATTEIYTLSLHDALPIWCRRQAGLRFEAPRFAHPRPVDEIRHILMEYDDGNALERSEEHTSELQSQSNLVCRLLLEKKKKNNKANSDSNVLQHTSHLQST